MTKSTNKIIKKYLSSFIFFFKELGYKIPLTIILGFSVGLLDGIGLASFIPLLDIIANQDKIIDASPTPIQEFSNSLGIKINLVNVLTAMIAFFLLKGLMKFISGTYQVHIFQSFIKKIRFKTFSSFNKVDFKYFSTADVGRIQNTLTSEVERVSSACRIYLKGIDSLALIITYLVLAYLSNKQFTLLVVSGVILTNFIYKFINDKTKQLSSILVKRNSRYQGMVIQYVSMFKYLKVSGRIQVFADKINRQIMDVESANKKIGILNSLALSIREPILVIILALIMFIQLTLLNGNLELIVLSILFFYRALQSVLMFQNHKNNYLALQGSLLNIQEFQHELIRNREKNGRFKFTGFKDAIRLKNVNFSYGNTRILSNINLSIKKYETIALVGESGSGKTTLINVLSALLAVDSGELIIDDKDMTVLEKTSYQKDISYVTQEPMIFNDTVFNNVTYFDEKNEHNLRKFDEAIKDSYLFEFIDELRDKEDTVLANNGINLSGGQKQRIAFAREIYKDSGFLFMDEATSALDSETEGFIQMSIENMKGKRTIVVAAHRLATIKHADRIVIMAKGEVLEIGSFEELSRKSITFKRMLRLQGM